MALQCLCVLHVMGVQWSSPSYTWEYGLRIILVLAIAVGCANRGCAWNILIFYLSSTQEYCHLR